MKRKRVKRQIMHPVDEKQEFEMTEALKALRTNIMFSMNQREHKRIIYTSAVPMEGKTSTSVNFSVILAQTGAKVVWLLYAGHLLCCGALTSHSLRALHWAGAICAFVCTILV